MDSRAAAAAVQSLDCLSHVLSWVPLDTAAAHLPPALLTKLFHFATFGCHAASEGQTAVGDAAMCCVNELLSKNLVSSAACEQLVLAVFAQTFSLLKSVTHRAEITHQHFMLVRFDELTTRFTFCVFCV